VFASSILQGGAGEAACREKRPAMTTVTVAALNSPDLLVEITVTACIPD
jgi:enamine deaminase RidA (YjgF/YER057c/UK114 family)